jgi:hypothetical protein
MLAVGLFVISKSWKTSLRHQFMMSSINFCHTNIPLSVTLLIKSMRDENAHVHIYLDEIGEEDTGGSEAK